MASRPAVASIGFVVVFAALVCLAMPAHALVVPTTFAGCTTIDRFTQVFDYQATVPFNYYREVNRLDIDVAHGVVDDGGLTSNIPPGRWDYDFDLWGPLLGKYDIQAGGIVTYGSPAPNVFAVTWVDIPSYNETSIRNTFQVVFFGDSSYHTNTGITIQPGSVIYAYGSPTDPHGTVHYSPLNGAAIGMNEHGTIRTLYGLGVGDDQGIIYDTDIPALQNSGDPFLFGSEASGSPDAVAFTSVPELSSGAGVSTPPVLKLALSVGPNPARGHTNLSFTLSHGGPVRLEILDVTGRRLSVLDAGTESAGTHARTWDTRASDGAFVPAGLYLARLVTADGVRSKAVVVMR